MTRKEILSIAKPILFNTDMVRAILDGRKTATRRIAKYITQFDDEGLYFNIFRKGEWTGPILREQVIEEYAPYKIGDILYVRETFSTWTDGYVYKAWTSPFPQPGRYNDEFMKWHPSIHMPKQAARIFLRVTDVRMERLHNIDGHGIVSEGVNNTKSNPLMGKRWENMQRITFSELWDSTIPKKNRDKYGWSANPWVWVIEFERVEVQ